LFISANPALFVDSRWIGIFDIDLFSVANKSVLCRESGFGRSAFEKLFGQDLGKEIDD